MGLRQVEQAFSSFLANFWHFFQISTASFLKALLCSTYYTLKSQFLHTSKTRNLGFWYPIRHYTRYTPIQNVERKTAKLQYIFVYFIFDKILFLLITTSVSSVCFHGKNLRMFKISQRTITEIQIQLLQLHSGLKNGKIVQ